MRNMRSFVWVIVGLVLAGRHSTAFSQAAHDLSWTQVSLAGMHLSLISPQKPNHSTDLRFSEKNVAIEVCDHHYCTGPLTAWKIEGNRLKIGYITDEGYTLIGVSASRLVIRDKNGTVYTYAIAHP